MLVCPRAIALRSLMAPPGFFLPLSESVVEEGSEGWQMGNAGAEAAAAAGMDRSTTIPKPSNWGSMTNTQRRGWWKKAKGKVR